MVPRPNNMAPRHRILREQLWRRPLPRNPYSGPAVARIRHNLVVKSEIILNGMAKLVRGYHFCKQIW
jgi:hypothetical protein